MGKKVLNFFNFLDTFFIFLTKKLKNKIKKKIFRLKTLKTLKIFTQDT